MHGPALGGVGLLLGKRWRETVLSSWFCHEDSVPWGSTGITDPLLSSAATCTRPYGAGHDRFEKIEFLARFPLALETLHVCWEERSETNCGFRAASSAATSTVPVVDVPGIVMPTC